MREPFRRLGLIGDVHAEDEYLAIAINYLKQEKVEALLCVGDLADGRGDLNRVCELLVENRVLTVRGNHDRWLLDGVARDLPEAIHSTEVNCATWEYLESLKTSLAVETVAGRLMLCHGMGDNDMGRLDPDSAVETLNINRDFWRLHQQDDITFVVAGHTHRAMARRFARGVGNALTVVNAGGLKHSHGPVFVLADFETEVAQFYEIAPDKGIHPARIYNWNQIKPEVL
jgi:predicted phosphodiesterase